MRWAPCRCSRAKSEVEIARRIERGKLAVIKSISRTPLIAKRVIYLGDQLQRSERTIRELVIFNDEEITEDRINERSKQVQKQIDAVPARGVSEKLEEKLRETPKGRRRATSGSTGSAGGSRCARASSCRPTSAASSSPSR